MADNSPAPARPSATVVIIRPGPNSPEVLLVRRRAGDAFGDSYAFPGGVVDEDEWNAHIYCQGRMAEEANALFDEPNGLDYYSAAVRELFEETGILLARDGSGRWTKDRPDSDTMRREVDKGRLPWPEFLRQSGLTMATDALRYFAYWETPLVQPKRWRTRFFVAELPPEQQASHDGSEVTDHRWLTPADALALGKASKLPMPFPTTRTLRDLSLFQTTDEMIAWAKKRPREGIVKMRPARGLRDGKPAFLLPGDPGYEEADRM